MNIESPDLSGLHAVESGTLGQRVYNELRDYLMVGGVKPGEKITLRQLTSAFGTSLMPVREAVQRLAAEGALEVLPNRAIRVPIVTRSSLHEILRVRLNLEGLAVEEATSRIRPQTIARLEELNDAFTQEMRNMEDTMRPFRVNKEFHFTIYRAAEMPVLLGIIENMWLRIGPFLHFSLGVRGREATRKFAPDSHKDMIHAMKSRDAVRGRAALESDLAGAADLILQLGNLPD